MAQVRHRLDGHAEDFGASEVLRHKTVHVSLFPVGAGEEFSCQHMPRIHFECPARPHDRVVVPPLMPVRAGDLHQNERRPRIALERLLLEPQSLIRFAKGLHEAAVMEQGLRMGGVDFERTAQAFLGADPIPFAEKQDRAQRHLRIGARIIQGKRTQGRRLCLCICFPVRHGPKASLRATGQGQTGMGGCVGRIDLNGSVKVGHRVQAVRNTTPTSNVNDRVRRAHRLQAAALPRERHLAWRQPALA